MEAAATGVAKVAAANPPHRWLVALAVMLGTTLEILDSSIVNVALPHMRGSFSASLDEISWVVTSYLVANGIMIPMTGWISSRFGRKRYFLTSVTLFIMASMLCGAAQSLQQMVVFRLLQGMAGAAMIPSSQAILMETFPPEEQQLAMAVWGMGLMVAPILGPTLGGWITDNWSWRWNFYINLPIGIIAVAMVSAFVHDPALSGGTPGQQSRLYGDGAVGRGTRIDAGRGGPRRARRLVQYAVGGLCDRGLGAGVCNAGDSGIEASANRLLTSGSSSGEFSASR